MERLNSLDTMRGLLFIPMLLNHINTFTNMKYNLNTYRPFFEELGNVRILYICIVGISLYMSIQQYKKTNKEQNWFDYFTKRIKKSKKMLLFIFLIIDYRRQS